MIKNPCVKFKLFMCHLCVKSRENKRAKVVKNGSFKIEKPCKSMIYRVFEVPRTGFEPAHPCERCDLNTVRLPISPPGLQDCKYNRSNYFIKTFVTMKVNCNPLCHCNLFFPKFQNCHLGKLYLHHLLQ